MLVKYLLTPALLVVNCKQIQFGSDHAASDLKSSGWFRGYATNAKRFEFFGKENPFEFVINTIKNPINSNGTDVVLVYNNVLVTLYRIPKEKTLEVINEDMFKSLPHKVITLDRQNNTQVINLDF